MNIIDTAIASLTASVGSKNFTVQYNCKDPEFIHTAFEFNFVDGRLNWAREEDFNRETNPYLMSLLFQCAVEMAVDGGYSVSVVPNAV